MEILTIVNSVWCMINSIFIIIVLKTLRKIEDKLQREETQLHQPLGQIYRPQQPQFEYEYEQPQVREQFSPKAYPKNDNSTIYQIKMIVFNDNKSTNDRITQLKKMLR